MEKFKHQMALVIDERARLLYQAVALTREAQEFRATILQHFSACRNQKGTRCLEALAQTLLNTDWRETKWITHHCPGTHCCRDRSHFCEKLKKQMAKLLKLLTPAVLNRANWLSWARPMNFLAWFLALHGILQTTLLQAFGGQSAQKAKDVDNIDVEESGRNAAWRQAAAENTKIALQWMAQESPLDAVLRVRISLASQIELMQCIIHESDPGHMVNKHLPHEACRGAPGYASLHLVDGHLLETFFRAQHRLLTPECSSCWKSLPRTEASASQVFKMVTRVVAVIFIGVAEPWGRWPCRIFALLHPHLQEAVAEELSQAPDCTLDSFSRSFRHDFPTTSAMLSQSCQQLLHVMASRLQTTTWSTETCHSRNVRRLRSRFGVPNMDLPTLATMYTGSTVPKRQEELERLQPSGRSSTLSKKPLRLAPSLSDPDTTQLKAALSLSEVVRISCCN